jgi:hypothetical protein
MGVSYKGDIHRELPTIADEKNRKIDKTDTYNKSAKRTKSFLWV